MRRRLATLALSLLAPLAVGCSSAQGNACGWDDDRFIAEVLWFHPGAGAGFGQDAFPQIVEGPPDGFGERQGSTDALSLGSKGEIAFRFGVDVVDGPGADFVIFENAFLVGATAKAFVELGEVSVSDDGEQWTTFPCRRDGPPYTGCAGWNPVLSNQTNCIDPTDPSAAGGDPFDLADIGVGSARYVKIRDLSAFGSGDRAGFDLDAAAVIHAAD